MHGRYELNRCGAEVGVSVSVSRPKRERGALEGEQGKPGGGMVPAAAFAAYQVGGGRGWPLREG
jgi:hypothetical protein